MMSDAQMYSVGDEIEGRFVLRELLGVGPLSATYRAEDTFSETAVLLQAIAAPVYAAAPDAAGWRELVRGYHLESGYVAPPRDTLLDAARGRMLMLLAPAGPLAGLRSVRAELESRGAPMRHAEAQLFGSQIALGLSALHRAGLVHGDLRSQNVLIRGGHALLVGVGVVPALAPSALHHIFAALPADPYRAPEVAEMMRPSAAADMYAAAVILAEMLGYFAGAANVDAGLSAVLARALAARPQDRFADIDAFAAALVTAFERAERKISGRPTPSPRTPSSPVAASASPPSSADTRQGVRASFGEPAAFVAGALEVQPPADSGETPPLARLGRPHPKVMLDARALASATPATPLPRTPGLAIQPGRFLRDRVETNLPTGAGDPAELAPTPPPLVRPSPSRAVASHTHGSHLDVSPPTAAPRAAQPDSGSAEPEPGARVTAVAAPPAINHLKVNRARRWAGWLLAAFLVAGATTLVTSVVRRLQAGRAAEAEAERRYRDGRFAAEKAAAEKAAAERAAAERAAAERAAATQPEAPAGPQAGLSDAQGERAPTAAGAGSGSPQLSGTAPAAAAAGDAAAAPPPAPCPQGMIRMARVPRGSYCISSHEFPRKGALPGVKVRKDQAARVCAARGARLCTRAEWENACSAGGTAPFGYGNSPVRHRCNAGAASHRKRLVPGGELRACRTAQGVYDMIGNVAEWVEEGVVMGGDVRTPLARANCENARPVPSGEGSSWIGFRCCAD